MTKTREELIAEFQNDDLELCAMTIAIDGHDQPLRYSQDMDEMPQRLHFVLPEKSTYTLTIRYRAKRPIRLLGYHQVVKKHGIPFDTRKLPIGDNIVPNTDDNPYHEVTFPPHTLPSGSLVRGKYPATSTFLENGKAIFSCEWIIEIVERDRQPESKGFD